MIEITKAYIAGRNLKLCILKRIMLFQKITILPSEAGERIDTHLTKKTGISRSQIQKLIESGDVLVNDKPVNQNYRIKAGDGITIRRIGKKDEGLIPEDIPIEIMYEDEHLVVVNKPPGVVVYPAAGHSHGTLMNALAFHCRKLASVGAPLRPGVVHRLDKDTSGVMVIALSDTGYYKLADQFQKRTIKRRYAALVYGDLKEIEGQIALKIGRSETDRKKMSTRVKRGKEAVTRWRVIKRFGMVTLIEAKLGTGRTHQIRVHFASIGHPVLGDKTYGRKVGIEVGAGKKIDFQRQMLHAEMLGFVHPATGKYTEFSSPLPADMAEKIQELQHLVSSCCHGRQR